MKIKKFLIAAFTATVSASILFAGCNLLSDSVAGTPQEVIGAAYGNAEFKISFSSEGLDTPLSDMTYTANNMPSLPTPERVGYIFEGWYLDKNYTVPYSDGILYLYMRDVTLYAKWSEEQFVTNGTYDIKFTASILEETLRKGALADTYGWKDFTACIAEEETCLEKSESGLMLRLQYDCGVTIPYGAAMDVFTVTPSSGTASRVYLVDSVDSYTDSVKTLFFTLDGVDLSETLYFDVSTINYENADVSDEELPDTLVKYTVSFDIDKIIGFSQAYVDPDVPLEEGYYLAKTYYKSEDNTENMGTSFNPVYSYVYSDGNEHYTLIKQNIPYSGLISYTGGLLTPYTDNFYNRWMTFVPVQLYFGVDTAAYGDKVEADYYPSVYHGDYYGEYSVEFHADTGKLYNIFDLGSNLKKEMMVMSAVTGFMEMANGMGYYNQILTIDYEHIVRLAEVDYQALEGDAYEYATEMQYYPGNLSDLNAKNLSYGATTGYGVSTQMINFFYSAVNAGDSYSSRTIHSSKITVSPTAATNAVSVADSRYAIAHFTVNAEVYGYDASSGKNLYADSMTVQAFGGSAMRETVQIKSGKSCTAGETVRLAEIYAEKVDADVSFNDVQYTAYRMNNGVIDWSSPVSLSNSAFTFESDIAVKFTRKTDRGTVSSVVELREYAAPTVKIANSAQYPYDPDAVYTVGDTVPLPYLTYSWYANSTAMIANFYDSDEGEVGVNPVHAALCSVEDGVYTLRYFSQNSESFTISAENMLLLYELTNVYGERYYYEFRFNSASQPTYTVSDGEGEIYDSGTITYDADGARKALSVSEATVLQSDDAILTIADKTFYFITEDAEEAFGLAYYSVYTNGGYQTEIAATGSFGEILNDVYRRTADAAYYFFTLTYTHGDDLITRKFVCNVNFSGRRAFEALEYDDYFTGVEYVFAPSKMYTYNGDLVSSGYISVNKFSGDLLLPAYQGAKTFSLSQNKLQYLLTFNETGKYRISYSYNLGGSNFGGADGVTFSFSQDVTVLSSTGDVSITYVTDEAHPFADGTTEKTVSYNLTEDIETITKSEFAATDDILFCWLTDENVKSSYYRSGTAISGFISQFNSQHVRLYAYWDPGITVTAKAQGNDDIVNGYLLNSSGTYSGLYQISLSLFSNKITVPKSETTDYTYVFVGWTGGFLGSKVYASDKTVTVPRMTREEYANEEYFIITAVFTKQYTVKFSISEEYSDDYLLNVAVLEGETIANASSKSNVSCKAEGYEFKGWYVLGDETCTLVDLTTYRVTENVTFAALFGETQSEVGYENL